MVGVVVVALGATSLSCQPLDISMGSFPHPDFSSGWDLSIHLFHIFVSYLSFHSEIFSGWDPSYLVDFLNIFKKFLKAAGL